MHTRIGVTGRAFYLNGRPTYSELPDCPDALRGLLMNARMIQGVFDDRVDPRRFDRFGRVFNPDRNTDALVDALPAWYAAGLRAVTVGFQGGGPCYTIRNDELRNNPFGEDGSTMDPAYLRRMDRLIRAADALGMAVIVSLFYGAQTRFLQDDDAVLAAVKAAANWLRDQRYGNIIVEIANEHDIAEYRLHPILATSAGIVRLLGVARRESGGMLVGCSGTGGYFDASIAQASDVILLHGNDQSRQKLWNLIQKAKAIRPERPVVVNEDSQALSNMAVCLREGVSWGYYNNMTKQEPPADWRITPGEDCFFADRMALALGILKSAPALHDRFYLQGLEPNMTFGGKRWIRLAAFYPEEVDYAVFYRDGHAVSVAYDDPFVLGSVGSNWNQLPFPGEIQPGEQWSVKIYLTNGTVLEKTAP